MIPELSIMPASPDGNSFEIVPGDMTGISYADYVRSLRSAEESPYSRLLVFRRNPGKKVLFGDVEALLGYSTGMYILVNTKLTGKNKRSVFAGVAGIKQITANDYWDIKNIPEPDADCYWPLVECLRKQSDEPPSGIKQWNLAIVIPMQSEPYRLFLQLCSILNNSGSFICWNKPPRNIGSKSGKDLTTAFSLVENIDLPSFNFKFLDALFDFISCAIEEVGSKFIEEAVKKLFQLLSNRKTSALIAFSRQNFSLKMQIKNGKVNISVKSSNKNFEELNINFILPKKSKAPKSSS